MFESLKHWFSNLTASSDMFDHEDEEAVHSALASLLFHVICADNNESEKEKHKFAEIMQDEFHLDRDQVQHLWQHAKSLTTNLDEDLAIINAHLTNNPMQRLQFLEKLNQLICLDGVASQELEIFQKARQAIFPEFGEDF